MPPAPSGSRTSNGPTRAPDTRGIGGERNIGPAHQTPEADHDRDQRRPSPAKGGSTSIAPLNSSFEPQPELSRRRVWKSLMPTPRAAIAWSIGLIGIAIVALSLPPVVKWNGARTR